jgi:hypothetical protein
MHNTYDSHVFPIQRIPLREKSEEWRKKCVDSIIARMWTSEAIEGRTKRERMAIAYDLYNGIFDEKDIHYVTNPFKVEDEFPASPQNINVIKPHIDLLLGEETKRPFNFLVIQTNDEVITELQEQAKQLLMDYIVNDISTDGKEPITLNEIERHIQYEYRSVSEKLAHGTLEYLKEKLNLQNEFIKGWKDALIAGQEIYYTGIINGEPYLERIDPLDCDFDKDSNIEFIEDGDWFCRVSYMTIPTVYDRFFDIITESQLSDILERVSNGNNGRDSSYSPIVYKNIQDFNNLGSDDNTRSDTVPVYHVVWRSFKKIGYLETPDGTEVIDESYKPSEDETVVWDWITEVWEGYRVGQDIYIGVQPVQYQGTSMDSLTNPKLPYTGSIYNDTNTKSKSLVEIMKPLQYMYIIIWYRLELALARDKGKIMMMDPTQIPKSMGLDINKWMHYLSALGVAFVNPHEEGWDVPGREGGKASAFNQMGAQDLSMSKIIADYIGLMDKIEQMIGRLSGVSDQRLGSISSQELVGNVERAVTQSSHITEPLFWKHNQIKKKVITALLNAAKCAWKDSGKKKLHYIMDDSRRVFMNITDDFIYADHDVFVTDSTQEQLNLQALKSLLEPALSTGAGLIDAATILTENNMTAIKHKLQDIEKARQQREQEAQDKELAVQQQIAQMQQDQISEANRIKEEDSIRKSNTAIEVALIQAEAGLQNSQPVEVGEEDNTIEYAKIELQREKARSDSKIKERALAEDIRKNKVAEEQKEKEIIIKRKAANKKPAASKSK